MKPTLQTPARRLAPLTIALFLLVSSVGEAGRVRALGIDTLTSRAGTIFSGRCVEARTVEHPDVGGPVVELTFDVLQAVKGLDGRQRITLRMLDSSAIAGFPHGAGGGIRPGDELVLFLYPESSLGLTSPVGLGQGRFAVVPDRKGGRLAINPWGNATLLKDVPQATLSRFDPGARVELASGRVRPETLLDVAARLHREPSR